MDMLSYKTYGFHQEETFFLGHSGFQALLDVFYSLGDFLQVALAGNSETV